MDNIFVVPNSKGLKMFTMYHLELHNNMDCDLSLSFILYIDQI